MLIKMSGLIRCGVVGVGFLGQHHARLYSQLEGCQLTGVLDQNIERAEEIAKLYHCQVFKNLDELIDNCDCVSVVTPTDQHAQVAIPLLQNNKHLLIEKPICFSLEDAEKIISESEKRHLSLQVGHIEHYNPVTRFLEQHVTAPRFISTQRLAPFTVRGTEVSVVLDLMIHDIGVILQLVRSEVQKIEAIGINVLSNTEDIANARLYFQNGCIADISASRISEKKVREIRIFDKSVYLSLDFMNQTGHMLTPKDRSIQKVEIPIEKEEPLKSELISFLNCVKTNSTPVVSARLGARALKIALEITDQIKTKNSA